MILAGTTIFLSWLAGLGGIISGLKENKLPKKTAIIYGIFQFVFCIDIVNSIVLYRNVKIVEAVPKCQILEPQP
jgi:hypothetical protein